MVSAAGLDSWMGSALGTGQSLELPEIGQGPRGATVRGGGLELVYKCPQKHAVGAGFVGQF